jgi:endonuclease/exonuclease/phosphatase family metal-dependent hydrolase
MADDKVADKKTSKWKWVALGVVVMAGLIGAVFAFLDPLDTQFDDVEDAKLYEAKEMQPAPDEVDRLKVMTWNVKFAGGRIDFFFDCHGDRVIMEEAEVIGHLEGLAQKINQVDPDVLLLQEVDIDSKRAAYVDQVQWLLDHTNLNYGAYASQWRAKFIPKHGIGKVDSGNAVLSKWPIEHAERLALPLISTQDAVTQYFYLKRNILRAKVDVPGDKPLWTANIHTAAFAQDGTKDKQIRAFELELAKFSEQGKTFVAGGDLNTIPPGSKKLRDFPDTVCVDADFQADDYSREVGLLDDLYAKYEAAIPLETYEADNARFGTHSTHKDHFWNRKLDYLFTNGEFVEGTGEVHQDKATGGMETMPLSDHAPVTAVLDWE